MKKQTMDLLVKVADELGIEVEGREKYSGRGMFGKETCGIVMENATKLYQLVAVAAVDLHEQVDEFDETDELPLEYDSDDFVRDLSLFRMDSMGHDTIVY